MKLNRNARCYVEPLAGGAVRFDDWNRNATCEWNGTTWAVHEYREEGRFGGPEITLKLTALPKEMVKKLKGEKKMEPVESTKEKPNFIIMNFLTDARFGSDASMTIGTSETKEKAIERAKDYLERQPSGGPRVKLVIYQAVTQIAPPAMPLEITDLTAPATQINVITEKEGRKS